MSPVFCCMCCKLIDESDSVVMMGDALNAFPDGIRALVSEYLWSEGVPDFVLTENGEVPRFRLKAHYSCVKQTAESAAKMEQIVIAAAKSAATKAAEKPKSTEKPYCEVVHGGGGDGDDEIEKGDNFCDPEDSRGLEVLPRFRPSQVYADLNLDIIGQDDAKKVLSVALCDHMKRIRMVEDAKPGTIIPEKSNVLLVGPSGCGKTEIVSTLADLLDVPFAKAIAPNLTVPGYVGEDPEEMVCRLYQESGENKMRAERGIIYIDEVDKLARPENGNYGDDIRGKGVQQSLLELIRGTEIEVDMEPGTGEPISIDTSQILFILSGSFEGLEKLMGEQDKAGIGFGATLKSTETQKLTRRISDDALVNFGLMAEFVGRVPVRVSLDALTEEELVKVLTEPRRALVKQYVSLFHADGLSIDFDSDALTAIAAKAKKTKTGVRALRSILEELLLPLSYDLPDKQIEDETIRGVHITKAFFLGEETVQYVYGDPPLKDDGKKLKPIAKAVRQQLRKKKRRRGC